MGAERIDAGSNPFVDTYGCTDHDIHRRRIRQPIAFRPPGRSVLQASPSAILILVPGVKERRRPQKPTLLARTLARVIQVVVVPVAAPAWAIEWILRRLGRPRFQFSVKNSIPYFVMLVLPSTWLSVFACWPAMAFFSLGVLTELEIVALAVAVGTATSQRGMYRWFLARVARRNPGLSRPNTRSVPVIAALTSLAYTTWYFGTATAMLYRLDIARFAGPLEGRKGYDLWWTSVYYSFSTITTAGSSIDPLNALAQTMAMTEVSIGILFFVFIIAVLTGRLNGND